MIAVALNCEWEGDHAAELASLLWLILSPGINLSMIAQSVSQGGSL